MLWMAFCALPAPAAQTSETCYGPLCIRAERQGDTTTLMARNATDAAPLSVAIALRLENMNARGVDRAVLRPGEIRQLVILTPDAPGEWRYHYDYEWIPGDYDARPDPRARYALPFRQGALPVLQSCNGWFSHRGEANQAVDIGMPEGTPVRAARAGRVILVKMDSRVGGRSRKYLGQDNKVLVQHDDGSVAAYAHMLPASARVAPGARVAVGDVLALSGNTGFSAQPHLHFELYTPLPGGGRKSWPVTWQIDGRDTVCPRRGTVLRN